MLAHEYFTYYINIRGFENSKTTKSEGKGALFKSK